MSERKAGFYFAQHPAHDGWLTAMVDDKDRWTINGYGKYLEESSFEVIGPRIPTPDETEGWQWVPVKPTAEMKDAVMASCNSIQVWADARAAWPDMLAAAPQPGEET